MKKILVAISALMISTSAVLADIAIGVTGSFASLDTSGAQTLKDTNATTNGSASSDVEIPELFIEYINPDHGATVGLSFIPTQELGSKTRAETIATPDKSDDDSGNNVAKADLASHLMLYAAYPIYGPLYVMAGASIAEIKTLESLTTGSTYGDETVMGGTIGLGLRGTVPFIGESGAYMKFEGTFTDYESIDLQSGVADAVTGTRNRVTAETEITAVKFSVGYKF